MAKRTVRQCAVYNGDLNRILRYKATIEEVEIDFDPMHPRVMAKNLTDLDLSPLAKLPNLTTLRVSGVHNLDSLSRLVQLTDLTVIPYRNTELDFVSPLINLIHLHYSGDGCDLTPLEGLAKLGTLRFSGGPPLDLAPLALLRNLTLLDLGPRKSNSLQTLAGLPSFRTLMFWSAKQFEKGALAALEAARPTEGTRVTFK